MSLANHERAVLATYVPDGRGGYETPRFERDLGNGYTSSHQASCSAEGYRQMLRQAELFEAESEAFELLTPLLGICDHGDDIATLIDDGELRWSINDYCCTPADPGATLLWMLWGMHDDGEWCFARSYVRGVVTHYQSSWFNPLLDLSGDYNVVDAAIAASVPTEPAPGGEANG